MKGYQGKIVADWSKVDFRSREGLMKFQGAFQAFMSAPDRNKELKAALQHFSTKGDFPTEVLQVLEKFHATPSYDLGYEQIFDIRDFTGTKEGGFEILNVASGLSFAEVKTGEKAKVYKMSGDKVTVNFGKYGGALGWDKVLMDDGKFWTMEDTAVEFRNKAYSSRAAIFYALIEAVSGQTTSWQAVEPASVASSAENYNAIRDVRTINAAALQILEDLKNDGVGANPNSQFILLAPVALKERLLRSLALVQQPFAGSGSRLNFNISPVWTTMLSSNSYYYVIFPKAKMKGGYRMDLTLFNMTNILEYTETVAGWMRYGGGIGDVDQVQKCSIA